MQTTAIPECQGPDPQPRPAGFAVPPGASDTHAHVFGPAERYPYTPDRTYTPPDAPLAAYRRMLGTLGLVRAVLIQPSVYGTDNSLMVDALHEAGDSFRGVAVVPPDVSRAELDRLHAAGVRGVRLNLLFRGGLALETCEAVAEAIRPLGWHLQLLVDVASFADLRGRLGRLPVEVVIDHMGHMPPGSGPDHPGFRELLALLKDRRTWVKLSGAYRITAEREPPYADVTPLAQALIEAAPDRLVWATDWPHPFVHIPMPNDGTLLDLLALWAPQEQTRRRILVDNPARLYDFPA